MSQKTNILLVSVLLLIGIFAFYQQGKIKSLKHSEVPLGYVVQPTDKDIAIVTVLDLEQNPVEVNVSDWQYYKNDILNFEFRYPPDYRLIGQEKFAQSVTSPEILLQISFGKEDSSIEDLQWIIGFNFYKEFVANKKRFIQQVQNNELRNRDIETIPYLIDNLGNGVWYYGTVSDFPVWRYFSWLDLENYDAEVELSYLPLSSQKKISSNTQELSLIDLQAVISTFREIK